jgi:hypothetical protein
MAPGVRGCRPSLAEVAALRALDRIHSTLRLLRLRLLLPLLFRRTSLPELLARLDRCGGGPHAADDLVPLVERLTRPLRLWRTSCLWRALAGYSVLRAAGADVRFFIGVRTGASGALEAHAWIEKQGRPSLGAPTEADGYRVAFAWPADPAGLRAPKLEVRVAELTTSDEAVLTQLKDGTGVLLHVGTKFYFTLNRTAVLAWKMIADEKVADAAALAARMAARFPSVDPGTVQADVAALVAELSAEGLLTLAA